MLGSRRPLTSTPAQNFDLRWIYEDDEDRVQYLDVLKRVVEDFKWVCHAYYLMTNHYLFGYKNAWRQFFVNR